ncbi:MAG: hypothetical protein R8G01_16680 [Ilumatobacteraceae bacterium]|nr:hypothetical protein [Ilumatobacteraceae bacterium]
MHWLIHTFRALRSRNAALAIAAVTVPIVAVVALAVVVVGQFGGEPVDAAPDPTSTDYTDAVLARVGAAPDEFVDDLVDGLVPFELSDDERADAISRIATALGTDDSSPAAIADALIRRLGPAATDAATTDELVALLVAEIDPGGAIDSVDALVPAIDAWASSTSPHVLRITAGAGSGILSGLEAMSYEDAVLALDELGSSMQVLEVGLGGIEGLDPLDVPGVAWTADDDARTITFTGATDGLAGRADAFVIARWNGEPTATLLGGLRLANWRLADAGFSGDLGETRLPSTTFLLADRPARLTSGTVGRAAWASVSVDLASGSAVDVEAGVTALTRIDSSDLPDTVSGFVDTNLGSRFGVRATFGSGFGVVDGSAAPSTATLAVEVPGLDPPALPEWIEPSDDLPWVLTLSRTDGDGLTIGLAGGLDAELDGRRRQFAGRFEIADGDESTSGRLVAELREPWRSPFGVGWLDLDTATMTIDVAPGASVARFESTVTVAGRTADLTFEVADGDTASVRLLAATEELTAADAIDLLTRATGAAAPAAVPDMRIDDVLIDIRIDQGTTVAIGGRATVAGQVADVLAGVESVGAGSSGVVLGVALDSWRLADAVPAVDGTLLDELVFPPSALVLSSMEGSIEPDALSEPARRFFGAIDSSGPLRLAPGVSLFGSLDLRDTALEAPLAAIGFDDGQFPVVGTIPGSAIGLGGSSSGSALRDLTLSVRLPEVTPVDAPDWYRGGRLSLVASGAPSLGLEGEMTVHVDGEDLQFVVGAEFARVTTGVELALFGQLGTDRPWESPFGVEWLTVNDAALLLTVDPIGTVGLGFGGSVVLGDQDVEIAMFTELTAGVPTNFAVQGASAEGLAFSDLIAIQSQMAAASGGQPAALTDYPDLAIRDAEIRFAPQPVERLGIEAGFALVGDVWIESGAAPIAALDFRLDASGLTAVGSLQGYDLGPIAWSDIALDLALTADDQYFRFDGEARLFGLRGRASIDLDTDSVFFDSRQVLDDIARAVELFEQLVDDPVGTLTRIDEVFDAAGVPTPPWVGELLDEIEPLIESGTALTDDAIDIILNGGTIPLVALPPGGDPMICRATTPVRASDGRCYTTPPLPATDGVPAGGAAMACPRFAPLASGGDCYTVRPLGERCLASFTWLGKTYGMQLRSGRCYARVLGEWRPSGGLAPTIDRGTPAGGVSKVCLVENPIEVGGRCYSVPPTPAVPGIPGDGADLGCGIGTSEQDGRCWIITPSQADAGLGVTGICTRFDVSCDLDDLVADDLARALFDGVMDRLRD